jgi:hypothetical protein
MKKVLSFLTVMLTLVAPVSAHHSMSAEFDISRSVTFKGTICSVEFSNPHSHIYVHVKLDNGRAETWMLELPAQHRFKAQGVPSEDFKPGASITILAYPSKTQPTFDSAQGVFYRTCTTYLANALRTGHVREATLSTGKVLQISDTWPETITVRQ